MGYEQFKHTNIFKHKLTRKKEEENNTIIKCWIFAHYFSLM